MARLSSPICRRARSRGREPSFSREEGDVNNALSSSLEKDGKKDEERTCCAPSSARQGGEAPCPPVCIPLPGRASLLERAGESPPSACLFQREREEKSLAACPLPFSAREKGRELCLAPSFESALCPSPPERRGGNLAVLLPRLDRAVERPALL